MKLKRAPLTPANSSSAGITTVIQAEGCLVKALAVTEGEKEIPAAGFFFDFSFIAVTYHSTPARLSGTLSAVTGILRKSGSKTCLLYTSPSARRASICTILIFRATVFAYFHCFLFPFPNRIRFSLQTFLIKRSI